MTTSTTLTRLGGVTLAAAALAVSLGAASSAHAATLPAARHGQTVTATTRIINRLDSGGNGDWAYDGFTRVLTVNYLGHVTPAQIAANPALAATPYEYDATLADGAGSPATPGHPAVAPGSFKDIPGAFTPNQGGRYADDVLRPTQVSGPMSGFGDFSLFYTSQRVNSPRTFANAGVPIRLRGPVQNALYPSATWPMLAFPAGTIEAGLTEYDWGYTYTVPAKTVGPAGHRHVLRAQTWNDTASNGGGQLRYDGNITGR